MPMQPRPIAETCGPFLPRRRLAIPNIGFSLLATEAAVCVMPDMGTRRAHDEPSRRGMTVTCARLIPVARLAALALVEQLPLTPDPERSAAEHGGEAPVHVALVAETGGERDFSQRQLSPAEERRGGLHA